MDHANLSTKLATLSLVFEAKKILPGTFLPYSLVATAAGCTNRSCSLSVELVTAHSSAHYLVALVQ